MKDVVCFDLDGTLADCSHRLNYIQTKPKNWKAFFAGIPFDKPIEFTVECFKNCVLNNVPVIIVTARPRSTEKDTYKWLDKHGLYYDCSRFYFRQNNDFRDDTIVKEEILEKIKKDGFNPTLAYDDRPKILRMWESKGIKTVDCGNGIEF